MAGKGFSILLAVVILLQSFSQLDVLAYYELNKSYIAEHFCINRDRPQMHCEGKCYLNKELNHTENKKDHAVNNKTEVVLYCENNSIKLPYIGAQNEILSSLIIEKYYSAPDFAVFHPPCV